MFHRQQETPDETAISNDAEILKVIQGLGSNKIDIVFDVGAYHGRYAKTVNRFVKDASIYCFEPFPDAFEVLKRDLTKACYHLYPVAMSDTEAVKTFYVNELNETNSLLPSAITNSPIDDLIMNKSVIDVNVKTIQDFCARENVTEIDLLKIDAQGNTLHVLTGATEMLRSKSIRIIQCEVEFIEIYKGQFLFHHVTAFLEDFGYKLYSLYQLHYDIDNRLSWADALYFIE